MTTTPTRPAHIDPRRWEAAPWHARQAVAAATLRAERQAIADAQEAIELAQREEAMHLATVNRGAERIAAVARLLELGVRPAEIVDTIGVTAESLLALARRKGRPAIARQFEPLRAERAKVPCPDCGKPKQHRARRCLSCAAKLRNVKRAS